MQEGLIVRWACLKCGKKKKKKKKLEIKKKSICWSVMALHGKGVGRVGRKCKFCWSCPTWISLCTFFFFTQCICSISTSLVYFPSFSHCLLMMLETRRWLYIHRNSPNTHAQSCMCVCVRARTYTHMSVYDLKYYYFPSVC